MMEPTLPTGLEKIAGIQSEHEHNLLEMENVVGVSLGKKIKDGQESDEDVVSVLVTHKTSADSLPKDHRVPASLASVKTDVVEIGDVFVEGATEVTEVDDVGIQMPFSPSLTRRLRPTGGGFSVGHERVTAGTIATCCYDLTPFPGVPRRYYILSNNHVLANSNNARSGDPILQPGRADGGTAPRDVIARLTRFVPIRFHTETEKPCNLVDAAIAEGNLQDLNREVYWSGHVTKLYTAPKVGDIVQKTGRTTGFTTGRVTNINATVDVNFGSGRLARFCRQIITTDMSAPGDSGSLVTNRDEGAVGLLFAGSSVATIINNVAYVQLLLRVRLTEQ